MNVDLVCNLVHVHNCLSVDIGQIRGESHRRCRPFIMESTTWRYKVIFNAFRLSQVTRNICLTLLYLSSIKRLRGDPTSLGRYINVQFVLYSIVSYRIVSHRIVSYRIVSYRVVSYRIVSYRVASHRIVSYRILSLNWSDMALFAHYIRPLMLNRVSYG